MKTQIAMIVLFSCLFSCNANDEYNDSLLNYQDATIETSDVPTEASTDATIDTATDANIDTTIDATIDTATDSSIDATTDTPIECTEVETLCKNKCVNLETDKNNCGLCRKKCYEWTGKECVNGKCQCTEGETMCRAICTDLQTDNEHCGTCGNKCYESSGAKCLNGRCQCDDNKSICNGACKDLDTNRFHCGECDSRCTNPGECISGSCICPEYRPHLCDGKCVTLREKENCGSCGNVCGSGFYCIEGECTCSKTVCNGSCVNTDRDEENCGVCGTKCGSDQTCCAGQCLFNVQFQDDPTNCGSCGSTCPSDTICTEGSCYLNCPHHSNLICETGENYETAPYDCAPSHFSDGTCDRENGETATSTTDCTEVCGDLICEGAEHTGPVILDSNPWRGYRCPQDCGPESSVPKICNNLFRICEWNLGETRHNCPEDCGYGYPPRCGDGECLHFFIKNTTGGYDIIKENRSNCPGDCPVPPDPYDDGLCSPIDGENCFADPEGVCEECLPDTCTPDPPPP